METVELEELGRTALRIKAERDDFRNALEKIMDLLYQKDQEEITRINDAYDTAIGALKRHPR